MKDRNIYLLLFATYLLLFLLTWYAKKQQSYRLFDIRGWVHSFEDLLFLQLGGVALCGIFPLIFFGWEAISTLIFGINPPTSSQIVATFIMTVIIYGFSINQSIHLIKNGPVVELSIERPHPSQLKIYFLLRVIYLISYELWFRGFLLFSIASSWGLLSAISINILLYALIHIFSDKKEMWACIPYGIMVCLLCWWMQAVWPAIMIHLFLSLTYEGRIAYLFSKNINRS